MEDNTPNESNEGVQSPRTSHSLFLKAADDTYSYRGWLNSDSFLKRAFAIIGYNIVAQIIISVALVLFFMVLGIIASIFA